MSDHLSPEEERVRAWLRDMGFDTEAEPGWLGGVGVKKPEFWAWGPHNLWVEVKRVTPPVASQKSVQFHGLIKPTAGALAKAGHGLVSIEAQTTEQSVQWVVSAINVAVEREMRREADHHFVYINDQREEVLATLSGEPSSTIRVRGRIDGKLPASIHLPQERWHSNVTLQGASGAAKTGKLYEFFELRSVACVGRAQIRPDFSPFQLGAIASGDASNTPKLRSDFKNAARKFRNAVVVRPAPCIVVLVPDPGAIVTQQDVAIAAFGDLTIQLTPRPNGAGYSSSAPFLHRNGVLRGGTHSTISEIVVFYESSKVIVRNQRAERPIELTSPFF